MAEQGRVRISPDGDELHNQLGRGVDNRNIVGQVVGDVEPLSIGAHAEASRIRVGLQRADLNVTGLGQHRIVSDDVRVDDVEAAARGICGLAVRAIGEPDENAVGYQILDGLGDASVFGRDDLERLDAGAAVGDKQVLAVGSQDRVHRKIAELRLVPGRRDCAVVDEQRTSALERARFAML
jgi:hypothetical protein